MSENQNQVSSPLRFLCLALDGIILARCIYKLMEFRWRYKYNIRQEPPKKQIRVWVDGVFDMMHFGHANMLRQGFVINFFSFSMRLILKN